jgi:hypothetical protein
MGWLTTQKPRNSSRPELVTNAVQHVRGDGAETIGVTLALVWNPPSVAVVVSDSSPDEPVRHNTSNGSEQGRGVQSWRHCLLTGAGAPEDGGKSVFAILAREV